MPLVKVCTAHDVAEAVVIRSALAAYGIRATLIGIEHCQQNWFAMQALQAIPVMVSEADYSEASALYAEAQRVETDKHWLSDAFWRRPVRNAAVVAVPWLCFGIFFMPWFRNWPSEHSERRTALEA